MTRDKTKGVTMKTLLKYENIEQELPYLVPVLKQALQTDMLYIKKLNKACERYIQECCHAYALNDAHYVIYSPYIKEIDHQRELFVFLDEKGKTICHIGGNTLDIGGLIQTCENLKLSDEYKQSLKYSSYSHQFIPTAV